MLFQLIKFLTVGSFNMLTDFAIFNLLLFIFHPTAMPKLFATSLTSSLMATVVSYFLNFYWTFRPEGDPQHWKRFRRFVLFAIFAIFVSQSIFLFTIHMLKPHFPPGSLLLPNLAKFIGVTVAAFVNFINYRMGVFHGDDLRHFRKTFSFHHPDEKKLWFLCGITVVIALFSRLAFLFLTTSISGDATHYANIGLSLVKGQVQPADHLWINMFTFWEGFIFLFTKDPTTGAIAANIIPGTLMVIPVFWIGKILFNGQIGFCAALITALHPRLIAFSCNGYTEIFYIFFVTLGVLCLTLLLKKNSKSPWLAFAFGVCLAVYVGVRNEGLLLYLAMLPTLLFIPRRLLLIVSSILGFSLTLTLYVSLSLWLLGEPGLGQKKINLMKSTSEQLDAKHSAEEIYGKDGLIYGQENKIDLSKTIHILIKRYPENILYTMERFPGVILTPLIFSAFLLALVWRPKRSTLLDFTPLLMMFIFPLVFYPLIIVEPRHFMMCLIPIHILGVGGLFATLHYLQPKYTQALFKGITTIIILSLIPITVWYGQTIERGGKIHRQLATWIAQHVPLQDTLAGDGFGYISTTAFLTEHKAIPRVWTDKPSDLQDFVNRQGLHWLIIYEPFLREANPELLNILDSGIPGMTKVYEVKDDYGRRYQIFHS